MTAERACRIIVRLTERELEAHAKECLRKVVEALDELTEEQLKAVIDAVAARQKVLKETRQAVIECDTDRVAEVA